jgi:hypothetical protein
MNGGMWQSTYVAEVSLDRFRLLVLLFLYSHVNLVKNENCLFLLHQTSYHTTPLGATPEVWNNKLLVYTGDMMDKQVPQAVSFPPLLLASNQQVITVDCIEQHLFNFISDDTLQLLERMDPATPDNLKDEVCTRHTMHLPPHDPVCTPLP